MLFHKRDTQLVGIHHVEGLLHETASRFARAREVQNSHRGHRERDESDDEMEGGMDLSRKEVVLSSSSLRKKISS